ncbi:MAG: adenylosuccinate lyase [Candidatus Omnitrophica bacterium]|nr:adenylosuccinate lyase [Candidatus Omnitrophota bacterium]
MVPRYAPPRMGRIWTEAARFQRMLEVELLACEALTKLKVIPPSAFGRIRRRARVDAAQVGRREARTRHDVVAFLEELASHIGKDARYLHLGLTSSDALDTATGVQLKETADLLLDDLEALRAVARRQARRYQGTLTIGRTHGVHAEPTTFGLKLACFFAELTRAKAMLQDARRWVAVGKVSGAVGTYAHLNPFIEKFICRELGLTPAPISTQVVPRDGYAVFLCRLAIVGGMLERMATEIRHLQRTEVLEAEEPFEEGQTGSSAMPHKRNPVSCERVAGLARLLRGYAAASLENIALWHERDISHSSVERVILPDASCVLDFMLIEMRRILKGLIVYPKRMRSNLELTRGLIFSESVLLALMREGLTRKEAYGIVQKHALAAWKGGPDFKSRLSGDRRLKKLLSPAQLDACFDVKRHLRHEGLIMRRLGLS